MEPENIGTPGGGGGNAPPAGLSTDDRAELERLRAENAQYSSTLAALDPYADDIKRFVSDEPYRNYVRESSKYYEQLDHRKPSGYSPEMQQLRDEILGEIRPVKEVVDQHRATQAADREARKTAVFNEGKPIVMAFLDQHPELRQSRTFGKTLEMLQEEAVETGRPFKEHWDNYISGFAGAPRREAPPRQLRAHDAEPGVPAATTRKPPAAGERPKTIREAFLETHARVNGKAS